MKMLHELLNSFNSFIHTQEGLIIFYSLFGLIILVVGKFKDKIKKFIQWRKWKKLNKRVKKQDKRAKHIVYRNTREEFLKKEAERKK